MRVCVRACKLTPCKLTPCKLAPRDHTLARTQERLAYLRRVRARGDVAEMMFAMRSDLLRNLGNMTNS